MDPTVGRPKTYSASPSSPEFYFPFKNKWLNLGEALCWKTFTVSKGGRLEDGRRKGEHLLEEVPKPVMVHKPGRVRNLAEHI